MNVVGSREFQSNYQRLEEPVVVKAKSRTLGTWYPKGTEPAEGSLVDAVNANDLLLAQRNALETDRANLAAEVKYLKSELAKRLTTKVETFVPKTAVRATVRNGGFGHSTPAPKGN